MHSNIKVTHLFFLLPTSWLIVHVCASLLHYLSQWAHTFFVTFWIFKPVTEKVLNTSAPNFLWQLIVPCLFNTHSWYFCFPTRNWSDYANEVNIVIKNSVLYISPSSETQGQLFEVGRSKPSKKLQRYRWNALIESQRRNSICLIKNNIPHQSPHACICRIFRIAQNS